MKTCATCRFMAAEREWYGRHTCARVVHGNDGDDHNHRKELAAVHDGSGYAARLTVLPEFGCVLHEEAAA